MNACSRGLIRGTLPRSRFTYPNIHSYSPSPFIRTSHPTWCAVAAAAEAAEAEEAAAATAAAAAAAAASTRAILEVNPHTHTAERQIDTPRISQRDAAAATTTFPRSRGHGMQRRNLARYRILFISLSFPPALSRAHSLSLSFPFTHTLFLPFSITTTTMAKPDAPRPTRDESDDTDTNRASGTELTERERAPNVGSLAISDLPSPPPRRHLSRTRACAPAGARFESPSRSRWKIVTRVGRLFRYFHLAFFPFSNCYARLNISNSLQAANNARQNVK